MKKKFLTLALTASMVLGSAFSAFAATISGAWWTAWTEGYEIADGATVEFDIDVKGGDSVWNNVAAVFVNSKTTGTQAPADEVGTDYKEYAVIRGDNWGWGGGDNKSLSGGDITYEGGIADLGDADFIATMKDCHIDATITRSGKDITMVYNGTGANGMTFTRTVKFSEDMSAGAYVFFVSDTSEVTVTKVESGAPAEDTTTAAENESTTVPSSNGKDPEVEPTTVPSSNGKDPEAEPTTGEENTSAPATEDEAGVVSAEVVAEIAKSAVVEGAPEGAKLEVNAIAADSEEYSLAKKFVTDELKAKAWAVLDLKLVDAENAVIQPDGKVKITLPVFENIKDAKYVAVYRLDDSKFTHLSTSEVKDGKFTFETDHFSTYLFASVDNPATDSTVDGSETTTGDTAPIAGMMVAALAAVGAVVLVSAKKKNA